jgi:hypothetical protein
MRLAAKGETICATLYAKPRGSAPNTATGIRATIVATMIGRSTSGCLLVSFRA